MEAAGRPSVESSMLAHDRPLARNESTKRKKSLPNIFVVTRQRSQRSLKSTKSPPLTAGVDRSFHSDPSFVKNSPGVPPLPSPSHTAAQLKNAEAKRRNEEQEQQQEQQQQNKGIDTSRHAPSSNANGFGLPPTHVPSDPNTRPSFSQRRLYNSKNSDNLTAPPPSGISTARPSHESQNRPPQTAALPKNGAVYLPSQGEMDNFDFKLPKRPHTATISGAKLSPKHESYPLPQTGTRPRQVSDAESSWAKSPKIEDFTPPWTSAFREMNRESANSGFSSASSTLDTKRSSIFTKTSTTSEQTIDMDEVDDYKDDIIDMYATKPKDRLQPLRSAPLEDRGNARDKRRSMAIAQQTELSIAAQSGSLPGTVPPSPMTPMTPMTPATPTTPAGPEGEIRLDNHRQHRPPQQGETEPGFDQYGFRKTSREVTAEKYESWSKEYIKIQNRRMERWKELMLNNGLPYEDPRCFPEPSAKTRRFIQKGIPAKWRGNAWFFYAGGHEYLDKYPGRYRNLLREAQNGKLTQLDKEAIERDLHRTFPDNIHFKPDQSAANTYPDPSSDQSPILAALRRVLSAFAVDHPKIGYCQSLNFLAGMLLLFLPEERAFWMLHIITTDILPGTHETSLEGANVDLWVLMLAIRDTLPAVWQKLGAMPSETGTGNEMWQPDSIRLPPISLCTTSWFMSLFIGVLPTETVLRVWDLIFYDGARVLFRVALAIFKLGEGEVKAVQDPMEIFQVVQSLPRGIIRCGVLMEQASNSKGKYAVTNTWVDRQRGIRKDFFARQRGVEIERKMSKTGGKKAEKDKRKSKESTTSSISMGPQDAPALGEVPSLERRPTRKKSAWSVKRSGTIRKVTSPLA